MTEFKKILVANRSEIAIRVMRAATELGKQTVAVYAEEDKLSLHRFKADEAYKVGEGLKPVAAYLAIDEMVRVALASGADAVHPGYGLLSEDPDFAQACAENGLRFIGPKPETLRLLGDKVSARAAAEAAGVPVVPATGPLEDDDQVVRELAGALGYPVMLKASWGGGGRGMRRIEGEGTLLEEIRAGRREAAAAFGRDAVYLERCVERARHVEVQILADTHGNMVHLYERDCSLQRRNQKIVERAPAVWMDDTARGNLCEHALRLLRHTGYEGAGTVEFLYDIDKGEFFFIEVNPRVQVEHTVTEEVTGVDIVQAQILIAEGGRVGVPSETGVPRQEDIPLDGHALQCRITTEDPLNNFIPDYGRITAYRGATGFGVRLDGGTAYSGAVVTRFYDSLLEKVTTWAPTPEGAIRRMDRALREFRIRGIATNLAFLGNLVRHPEFREGKFTTRFIDDTAEIFAFVPRGDTATRLLNYIADISVNGHPETVARARPPAWSHPPVPVAVPPAAVPPEGWRTLLQAKGADAVAQAVLAEQRVLLTDTTMRDAHQSLLATRMRGFDLHAVAPAYAHHLPQLFSLECWGGATFDVSLRFLQECPWQRLRLLREAMPNTLLQMLLRAANGVGYTNYPDNVVAAFTRQAAASGVDLFRIFDSLNVVENMRVAIDTVLETGKICEAAICYTGDMLDPERSKYNLDYYLKLARELKSAGTHILGLKDMAGLLRPEAGRVLVAALKEETGLPVHFHTHDTSGGALATAVAVADAGADIIDGAMDALSGMTSQPCLGSLVEALRHTPRDTGINPAEPRRFSRYWEEVRLQYAAFESDLKAPASEVYLHEMPGGQFTNLREQARGLGLEERWTEVAETYAEVNQMFGDIPKVTPSSKVVGDLALMMVSSGLSRADVEDPKREIPFPASVVGFFRGELGTPPGGFPKALQRKVLKGEKPIEGRPGAALEAVDLEATRAAVSAELGGAPLGDEDLCSYLMYPKVFLEFAERRRLYGPVENLPTPLFFYGMEAGQETAISLARGKTLIVLCLAIGETDDEGFVKVFFELNGQPRVARVPNRKVRSVRAARPKARAGDASQVAAPMPGLVAAVVVEEGQAVRAGDLLLTLEAMKMETAVRAEVGGRVKRLHVASGATVEAKDLLVELEAGEALPEAK